MTTLFYALGEMRGWSGSMADLAATASMLCQSHPLAPGLFIPPTSHALVVSYRTFRILPPAAGKKFTWHHLVSLIAARYLSSRGLKGGEIAAVLAPASLDLICSRLENPATLLDPVPGLAAPAQLSSETTDAVVATRLLAAGLIELYRSVRTGSAVVHDRTLNANLTKAAHLFSALCLREAKRWDKYGSVHDLTCLCKEAISAAGWGLAAFEDPSYPYRGVVLIDPVHRIPTLDCIDLAGQGNSELDILEALAFEELQNISAQFVGRQDAAYSALRFWIAQHPVTTVGKMRTFESSSRMQLAATFLAGCYEPVQSHHLTDGSLYVCKGCRTPMLRSRQCTGHLACTTPQCRLFDRAVLAEPVIFDEQTRIAKRHLLVYWVGPAVDEIALHQLAVRRKLDVVMYPERDACDLAWGTGQHRVGVDVKSNASPFALAASLSRSSPRMSLYPRRIIAVNDQAISRFPGYLKSLACEYRGAVSLEFMSVRQTAKLMESAS